jgi:hypothetical protein
MHGDDPISVRNEPSHDALSCEVQFATSLLAGGKDLPSCERKPIWLNTLTRSATVRFWAAIDASDGRVGVGSLVGERILVIGGGIAGLATALALKGSGCEITLGRARS